MEGKLVVADVKIFILKNSKKIEDWDPVSPNCPKAPNTLKQVEVNPQMAFKLG